MESLPALCPRLVPLAVGALKPSVPLAQTLLLTTQGEHPADPSHSCDLGKAGAQRTELQGDNLHRRQPSAPSLQPAEASYPCLAPTSCIASTLCRKCLRTAGMPMGESE